MYNLIIKILLLVVIGGAASLLEWFFYCRHQPRFKRKNKIWSHSFLQALHQPLQTYLWVIVATFIASIVAAFFSFNSDLEEILASVRLIFTLFVIFWFTMRFIRELEEAMTTRMRVREKKKRDATSVHAGAQLVRVIIILIVLLMILQTIGIKMSALLAFGGIGAAVIGFAAKDTLGNFFGGMMIYWDRPFSVGDWIRSPDRAIEGNVEYVGWRLTRIRTLDKRPLYVPNGVFSNIIVENPSRMTHRRFKIIVGVRYSDASKIPDLAKAIEEMLRNYPSIDPTQPLFVNLFELAPSSLNILVYAVTKNPEWENFQAIQQEILLKIVEIVSSFKAECAFPTQTVCIPEGILLQSVKGDNNNEHVHRRDRDKG